MPVKERLKFHLTINKATMSQSLNKSALCLTVAISLMASICRVDAIGCYKCSSTNNDTSCIDPFNPGLSSYNHYEPDCKAGIPGRYGLFPARFCLKVSGLIAGTNEPLVIRTCTVSKLLDSDSSHSSFTLKLDDNTDVQVLSGLIASCKDDGCNSSSRLSMNKNYAANCVFLCLIVLLIFIHFAKI